MSKKSKKKKESSVTPDRPLGPAEHETESGLVYGRWYVGAPQDCPNRCHSLPEGQHVPPCPLNTSQRAEPEGDAQVEEATAETAEVGEAT